MMKDTEITPDGWMVSDLVDFRMLTEHSPPRPQRYRDQLKVDARSRQPLKLWAFAGITAALAVLAGWWWLFAPAIVVLAIYVSMSRRTVRYLRTSPVHVGVITTRSSHPVLRDYSTASARLSDGREVPVYFPNTMAKIVEERGAAEVLVAYDPASGYSMVFAARPMSASNS